MEIDTVSGRQYVGMAYIVCLRPRLFLLLLPQGEQRDTRDLDDLEADTGNITDGTSLTTETGDQDFIVLLDKVQATVILRVMIRINPHVFQGKRTGTKAVTFFPFLINCTRTHLRTAELGCLDSTPLENHQFLIDASLRI